VIRRRPRAARAWSALALALVVLVFAGCGADTEGGGGGGGGGPTAEQQVRTVVAKFGIAAQHKDYRQICDNLLADELVAKIESVGLPCEAALQRGLGDVRAPTLEITQVTIQGGRALVSVHTTAEGQQPSDDALQLVREGDEWRIASLAAPQASSSAPSSSAAPSTTTAPSQTTTAPSKTTGKSKR
jgi:hypothetical protein